MTWEMLMTSEKWRSIPRDFFLLETLENFSCARVWVLQSGRRDVQTQGGRLTRAVPCQQSSSLLLAAGSLTGRL